MGSKELLQDFKALSENILSLIDKGSSISIVSHLDADGIISGGIISIALARLGARYVFKTVSDLTLNVIEQMKREDYDFYIILDLGGGMSRELRKAFDERWAIIDHHWISKDEMGTDFTDHIFNSWSYGIDGGREISAGGMAYLAAHALERKNWDLSGVAVVSAMADRQDQGDKKSLIGMNSEIVKIAESHGLVSVDLDLMFLGRETRPLHEALAYTSFPYIEGLTWNTENCYTLIKNTGINMKENGRWRVLSEITQEEKSAILDAIAKYVATKSKNTAVNVIDNLIGYTYTLENEDQQTHVRDAREFSMMVNACGRMRKAGVGIGICMGDRDKLLAEGEEIATKYRVTLSNYASTLFAEKWRLIDYGTSVFVNGEGVLGVNMLGGVSSLLSGSLAFSGRLLFVRTLTEDGAYKFSGRKCLGCHSDSDLGKVMRECSRPLGGFGGGHAEAAGCRIPAVRLEEFISLVKSKLVNSKAENVP